MRASGGFMKKICGLIAFLFLSQTALGNVGFRCSKLQTKIAREMFNGEFTLVIRHANGKVEHNPNLVLPIASTTDAYQERYGHYYILMNEAHLSFPYMPEGLLVFHVGRSTSLYKKGFKAFEGMSEPVELSKLYCRAFMSSILKF
jgi:hypothetical protein